jgi:hypothetical protein
MAAARRQEASRDLFMGVLLGDGVDAAPELASAGLEVPIICKRVGNGSDVFARLN